MSAGGGSGSAAAAAMRPAGAVWKGCSGSETGELDERDAVDAGLQHCGIANLLDADRYDGCAVVGGTALRGTTRRCTRSVYQSDGRARTPRRGASSCRLLGSGGGEATDRVGRFPGGNGGVVRPGGGAARHHVEGRRSGRLRGWPVAAVQAVRPPGERVVDGGEEPAGCDSRCGDHQGGHNWPHSQPEGSLRASRSVATGDGHRGARRFETARLAADELLETEVAV